MKNDLLSLFLGNRTFRSYRGAATLRCILGLIAALFLLAGFCLPVAAQSGEWAWMGGSSTQFCNSGICWGQPGIYGTLGTPTAGNVPGAREEASSWTDSGGHLWLFGGYGFDANDGLGCLNDFWEFNPSTNEWTWMGGEQSLGLTTYPCGPSGVYGKLGTPATGNSPGGRWNASSWTDTSGHLWLFGGHGVDASGNGSILNDLWEFDISTNEWAWMGGSSAFPTDCSCGQPGVYGTLGVPATGNTPGGRVSASS